ncbi:MAG TPA: hypothetical protein VGC76_15555 [Pyrinomonadaceae bacterium]|jgi:hypothetical protein
MYKKTSNSGNAQDSDPYAHISSGTFEEAFLSGGAIVSLLILLFFVGAIIPLILSASVLAGISAGLIKYYLPNQVISCFKPEILPPGDNLNRQIGQSWQNIFTNIPVR